VYTVFLTFAAEISGGILTHVDVSNNGSTIPTVLGIVWAIAGALALLMVTVSGLRYIISAGDPQKAAKAKNGIVYSLVGLVIAISAEAIVAYVGNNL
jgi:tellurite resistance protein TehA-like permease